MFTQQISSTPIVHSLCLNVVCWLSLHLLLHAGFVPACLFVYMQQYMRGSLSYKFRDTLSRHTVMEYVWYVCELCEYSSNTSLHLFASALRTWSSCVEPMFLEPYCTLIVILIFVITCGTYTVSLWHIYFLLYCRPVYSVSREKIWVDLFESLRPAQQIYHS